MNEWKFQLRRKKRGEHCLVHGIDNEGNHFGSLCGCGNRTPPSKKYKNRIIKRFLNRELENKKVEDQ